MKDGIIKLNTDRGKKFGFFSDLFFGYLWKRGDYIIISFIESLHEGQGNLSKLFSSILDEGYGIKVPTPFARMEKILRLKGFKQTYEYSKTFGEDVEIWVKEKLW